MLIVVINRGHSTQVTTQYRWALQVARDYVLQVDQARSLFKSVAQYRKFLTLQSKKTLLDFLLKKINIVPGMLKYK